MKSRRNTLESGFTLIEVIVTLVVVAIVAAMMSSYFGTSITQSSVPIARLNTSARLQETMQIITAQYIQSPHWRPSTTYAAGTTILPTTSKRTGLLYTTISGGTSGANEPTDWLLSSVSDNGFTWTPFTSFAAPTLINQTWRQNKPYSKNTIIVNGNYQYVTTTGGTSGTTEPTWASATTIGSTVTPLPDGVTWKCSRTPAIPAPTVILQTLIGAEGTDQTQTFGGDTINYRVIENKFIKFDTSNAEQNINADPGDGSYGMYLKVTIGHRSDASDWTAETETTLFAIR